MKPQPSVLYWQYIQSMHGRSPDGVEFGDKRQWRVVGEDYPDGEEDDVWCRWQVGDELWIRETWQSEGVRGYERDFPVRYRADGDERVMGHRWRSPIHMPRWASRITLRITEISPQRLQDISETDAIAEGITKIGQRWEAEGICATPDGAVDAYRSLWEYINGSGSWARNDWVWRIAFEVIKRNVDDVMRGAA